MKYEKPNIISISPRKSTDRGGYACMPLAENIPNPREDWILRKCPSCGSDCYEMPMVKLAIEQGAKALCTKCALSK